jgi:anti-anti-sigma factor
MLTPTRRKGDQMNLGIAATEGTDPTVVSLDGELDIASASQLEERINALVDAGHTRLIVELGNLIFCDSTGIGTLVRANMACQQGGGYLRLAAPNPNVARVLGVVGLLDAFPAYQTVDAARAGDAAGLVAA